MSDAVIRIDPTEREALEAGFAERVRSDGPVVFGVAWTVLHDRAAAEEVAQDAFLGAYRKMSGLRDPQKFKAWVCRIAYRKALNLRRRRQRRRRREEAWGKARHATNAPERGLPPDGEQLVRCRETLRHVVALPPKLRDVILLSAIEGLDGSEIALVLRIPAGTVRSRLHLARKRLLEDLS